jgi:signal transduction histidine kinase
MPTWAMNLAGFGLLILLVLAAFFWQMLAIDRDLQRNTLGRSRMVGAIVEENLRNASLARTTIDKVVTTLLYDKARFIDYLHGIDPLESGELDALARESGLLGIGLVHASGEITTGPGERQIKDPACDQATGTVRYDPQEHSAYLTVPATGPELRCIVIGLNAESMLDLQQKTSLPTLLATLSGLPGFHYVRLDEGTGPSASDPVRHFSSGGKDIAETRLKTAMGTLVVGLDVTNHRNRIEQMRHQFVLFAALLLGVGLFFSWLLYRVQEADLARTRTYERLLAREHEAAALGRATATIAHEVRNPLNAISMGLQRFKLESDHLDPGQLELLGAMGEAVRRADTIVSELQRFTRTLEPRRQRIAPQRVFQRLLPLYQQRCLDLGIEIRVGEGCSTPVEADPDLLTELLENLLKNGIEAQPNGGFLHIDQQPVADGVELTMTSGGCDLGPEQAQRLGEPYFTTKVRGTGLGLALCRRIAEAHGGSLRTQVDRQRRTLTVAIILPATKPGRTGEQREQHCDGENTAKGETP